MLSQCQAQCKDTHTHIHTMQYGNASQLSRIEKWAGERGEGEGGGILLALHILYSTCQAASYQSMDQKEKMSAFLY
jgi:hypothetical protein